MLEMLFNYERAELNAWWHAAPISGKGFVLYRLNIFRKVCNNHINNNFYYDIITCSLSVKHFKTIHQRNQRILFYVNKFNTLSPHRDWNPRPHACGCTPYQRTIWTAYCLQVFVWKLCPQPLYSPHISEFWLGSDHKEDVRFCIFFWRARVFGHSFTNVAKLNSGDVWIWTQGAAVASRCATNLDNHLPI